ncbi:MAG: 30S ribosomal protein S14 [Methylacidiphilales bacterium]|nr:30S ribosomal protein S14 [Candidatus Methylacidiphilales bacterium]
MAKLSIRVRNYKKISLVQKHLKKRMELKLKIKNYKLSNEERELAKIELMRLPINSNPIRVRNRCELTGRPRGYYRKFGLSRCVLREVAMRGEIPGLTKASW